MARLSESFGDDLLQRLQKVTPVLVTGSCGWLGDERFQVFKGRIYIYTHTHAPHNTLNYIALHCSAFYYINRREDDGGLKACTL